MSVEFRETNHEAMTAGAYWQRQWVPYVDGVRADIRVIDVFIMEVNGKIYLSSRHRDLYDLGPFPTLEDAKAAAETMIILNEYPFRRKDG